MAADEKAAEEAAWQAALRENMRECFDGMRAYHQSEIAHTNHAVTMLLAIAGAFGVFAVAIVVPDHAVAHLAAIAWGLGGVVTLFAVIIALTAHLKIDGDHSSYERHREELKRTAKELGLYDAGKTGKGEKAIKDEENESKGLGYRRTQRIIWAFAAALAVVSLVFALNAPLLLVP